MQIKPAPVSCYRKLYIDDTDHPVARERLRLLNKVEELRRTEGLAVRAALVALELPKSTYYDWRRALRAGGVRALVPQSRRPHRCPQRRWTRQDEQRVLAERRKRPYCGKRRLWHLLQGDPAFSLSVSSVGRILQRGVRLGRIQPCAFCQGRIRPKRRRCFAGGHARRWRYGERAKAPGERVQIDTMSVQSGDVTLKEFRAVCPFTRRMFSRVYSVATAHNARRFLHALLTRMATTSIQVDGGSEFRSRFEEACAEQHIELSVLPPRRPQYNGIVERANGTSRTEFWSQYDGDLTVAAVNQALEKYLHYFNNDRPHCALGMMTPNQYFATLTKAA